VLQDVGAALQAGGLGAARPEGPPFLP